MSDTELFELCKEVYKRTGWSNTEKYYWSTEGNGPHPIKHNLLPNTPLYTSDYLLDKLPKRTDDIRDTAMLGRATDNIGWSVVYQDIVCLANTPLKALLKLIIALDDAKELPHD